ncbi:MAG: arylsulfatase A [Verrucomicrobiales bacterium]|jgi:arylsulfatase A
MKPLLTLFFAALAISANAADRPNVIVIMADDMGYENLSCHGSKLYQTPHLDKLAESGMRFNNAHSQPICTPSRVQIMTGIYNNRNYVKFGQLDPEVVTFGNLMRDSGYKTAIGGKWQLQGGFEGVKNFGFDRHCLWQLTRRPSRYPNPGLEIDGEELDFKNGEFGPDLVSDYLCDFIEEQKDSEDPFFIYYPMIPPHWPFVPTPGSPDWDPEMWRDAKNEPGGFKDQKYWAGMVTMTDAMVGKVVNKLDELGMRKDTLVIFTCDNGTYTGVKHEFDGREMAGGKGSTKDSGTHVPFIASWPGTIQSGQVRDELVDLSDVLPTAVDVGAGEIPAEVDGQSLKQLFKAAAGYEPREYIYCWYERNGVREKASQHVRNARYKLYASGKFFDTDDDPLEKIDLTANGVPEQLAVVHAQLTAALKPHVEATKKADPIQKKRRGDDKPKKDKKEALQEISWQLKAS